MSEQNPDGPAVRIKVGPKRSARPRPGQAEQPAATAIPSTEAPEQDLVTQPLGATVEDMLLWFEVRNFLSMEARLQDECRFHEWVELFTDDLTYWMPVVTNRVIPDLGSRVMPFGALAHFEETKATLKGRVSRLDTGMAWAESPPSRTRHLVGNVEVERIAGRDELRVRSAFILYRTHMELDEDVMAGSRDDILRRVDGQWRIARRTIVLDQSTLLAKNLAVFF